MLPELAALEKILDLGAPHLQVQVVQQVSVASGTQFPIYAIGSVSYTHLTLPTTPYV